MYKFENCSQFKSLLTAISPSKAHPAHSRFESFFEQEGRKAASPIRRSEAAASPANAIPGRIKAFHFSIDNVTQGVDTRTTVMIKNLSHSLSKERLRHIFSSYCQCDYIYIPVSAKGKILGFAFVNAVNTQELLKLYDTLNRAEQSFSISSKKATICYSKMQGVAELSKAFGGDYSYTG